MKKIILCTLLAGTAGLCAAQEMGNVISATPIVQQVGVPRQICNNETVVQQPRSSGGGALLGALVGASLAMAGVALQGLFGNPLADPGIVGVSQGAALGAVAAIEDVAYYQACNAQVIASREKLIADLQQLGFEVLPSAANFIFGRHPRHDAAALAQALRARSIIVRHFKSPARISAYLRITIGTDEQSKLLINALSDIL